jgi:glycosyltransferase involved in cell wall biosynthesis
LSWHPHSSIVVEEQLGLAFARRRGFLESRAELIVNVDDDNVLDPSYLTNVVELAAAYPFVGAFGAQNGAEFETPPTREPNYYYGAQRLVKESVWSNLRENIETTPWGAGSVVRRSVANHYIKRLDREPRLLELGRRGNQLLSCEDIDIANSACDLGLAKGVFKELVFTHLIPAKRMTDEFKINNSYWNIYSAVIHNFLQYGGRLPARRIWQNLLQLYLRSFFRDRVSRAIMFGEVKAERDAVREIKRRGWV